MSKLSKNIIIITNTNFPFGGAAANFLRYFSTGLATQNNNVEVILPTGNYYGNRVDCDKKRNGTIDGVSFRHLCFTNHPKNYIGKVIDNLGGLFLPVLYLIRRSLKGKLDIIIIYDTAFFKTLMFIVTKALLRKKILVILPEYYEKPVNGLFSLSVLKWYSFFYGLRIVAGHSDAFIVMSHYMERYLNGNLKNRKKILIIPGLTDPQKFNLQNVEPFRKDVITIGYTGTPTRKDGILDLIKSFSVLHRKHKNTHLLIIGDLTNGESLIPVIIDYSKALGVGENITFTGLVSHNLVPRLLNSCQILALTRPNGVFAEAGFPTKLSEYFACKKPVLITKVGDIPRYFNNEEHAELVEPESIESIVSGFERLLMNEKIRMKISQNGFNWMNQNTNFMTVSQKIDSFLEQLILDKRPNKILN